MLREVGSRLLRGRLRAWAKRRFPAHVRPRIPDSPEGRALYAKVAAIPYWCHSIDLGMGVVTPGIKTPPAHRRELASLRLPDLRGKSVLDIGAWDGFYSFTAERLGASRVVALDHHVWGVDRDAKEANKAECRRKGFPQRDPKHVPSLWNLEALPGKRGFDDPVEALRRVRQVTKEVAVIETEAIAIDGFENRPLCEFFPPSAKLADDPTNYWAPSAAALVGLCEEAGFTRVEVLTKVPRPRGGRIVRYRLVAHASP
jgi:tRNA (mo5U34)-methyltransferase